MCCLLQCLANWWHPMSEDVYRSAMCAAHQFTMHSYSLVQCGVVLCCYLWNKVNRTWGQKGKCCLRFEGRIFWQDVCLVIRKQVLYRKVEQFCTFFVDNTHKINYIFLEISNGFGMKTELYDYKIILFCVTGVIEEIVLSPSKVVCLNSSL